MKVGILKADSVLPQFIDKFGDYSDMMVDRFGRNAPIDVSFEIYDVEHFEYPADIDACDGYVITGSKKSVYDDEAWIHRLEDYVRVLHDAKKPLVGICFGHQLVAQALGGKTEPASVGWGVGVHSSTMVAQKPFMQPAYDEVNILVSHKDQVSVLPDGAERLATSAFCPNSMFQVGDHIFCMQGHPEFIKGYSAELMSMRREIIGEAVFNLGERSLESAIHSDDIAVWIVSFLQQAASKNRSNK